MTKPNPGSPAINDMNGILSQGYLQNKQLARQKPFVIPRAVNNALLPGADLGSQQQEVSEKRFNIAVNNVPAQTFFSGLLKGTQYNIVISPKISGNITLNLHNVTIDEALQAVHDNYGYEYKKTSYGYQIFPPGLETKMFTVNYLDITRKGQSDTSISGTQLSSTDSSGSSSGASAAASVNTTSQSDFWKDLSTTLTSMIGNQPGEKIIINADAGLIVVRAYPDELKAVAKYLDSVQTNMTRQVILEAKVLEVELTNDYNDGVDWSALGLSQDGSNQSSDLSFSEFFSLDSRLRSFSMVIKLLSQQGNVQTLSSPRIATLNNQKAIIKVGNDEYFITNIDTTTTTGTATSSTENVDMKPFFSGISLDVTPQINAAGDVILHIHPLVSTVSQKEIEYTLRNSSGTGTSTSTVPTAKSKIRETDNVVAAKNGQIVVIGGLMINSTEEQGAGVPFLSKAPLVGPLFRKTAQNSGKSELVVLLRPIVVGKNTWTDQLRQQSIRMQKMNRGYHFGSHPEVFGNLGENFPTRTHSNPKGNGSKSYILGS